MQLCKTPFVVACYVLQDQYLEMTTSVAPDSALFGLEERSSSRRLQLERAGSPLALWNKDSLAANADQNLYGSHPFLMEVRSGSPALSCLSCATSSKLRPLPSPPLGILCLSSA